MFQLIATLLSLVAIVLALACCVPRSAPFLQALESQRLSRFRVSLHRTT